ncbi:uncharacterized protein LOC112347885 [Selaginella moellendorffii]|uniref:uncharacterized protein LOC112347885 n=1 Tax=Selaginella moellendorffii TaxID=88036 RepID=UPI000D1D09F1|nr:uncharacterized protein LOC112347885 [Selaginella moellendorffii]|eukprot:XP_024535240.1 uncharacterized protein LOC112347885 [Selaginella moellendorffii]
MDDFELGMSSGISFFRDEFYESFQAPKFYDFINPRDSGNADAWFLDGLASKNIKDLVNSTVQSILQTGSNNASRKQSLIKDSSSLDPKSPRYEQCSENKDPNQVKPVGQLPPEVATNEIFKKELAPAAKGVRKLQKPGEVSPVPQVYRYLSGNFPATVPQKKKVLGTRKATQQQPFSKAKALFQKLRDAPRDGADCGSYRGTLTQNEATVLPARKPVEAAQSELQVSQKKQGDSSRDSEAAAKYVVEQAVILESAIKLLRLGDEEKTVKVCSEVLGAVCADKKSEELAVDKSRIDTGNFQETKPAFSFKATRKENTQQTGRRRRKISIETTTRRKTIKKAIPPVACPSPPPSLSIPLKRPRVTCPQPFRLRTEERGALKEIEFNKKMEQYIALREGSVVIPPSAATSQPKAFPLKRKHQRAPPRTKDNRSPVEVSIEMITKDLATSQTLPGEPVNMKDTRRQVRMPLFDRPFRPQRSTKKLTIPIEPKFHAINARRTCSKHCHSNAQ